MTSVEAAIFAFTAFNTLRVAAYVPQIIRIARDQGGATAISYMTWALFGASHLSTVAYAAIVLEDWKMAVVFSVNTAACVAVIGLTFHKRLRFVDRCNAVESSRGATGTLIGELSPRPMAPNGWRPEPGRKADVKGSFVRRRKG